MARYTSPRPHVSSGSNGLHRPASLLASTLTLLLFLPTSAWAQLSGVNSLLWRAPPAVAPIRVRPVPVETPTGISALSETSGAHMAPVGLGGFYVVANA